MEIMAKLPEKPNQLQIPTKSNKIKNSKNIALINHRKITRKTKSTSDYYQICIKIDTQMRISWLKSF